jgi:hypothetical protein
MPRHRDGEPLSPMVVRVSQLMIEFKAKTPGNLPIPAFFIFFA